MSLMTISASNNNKNRKRFLRSFSSRTSSGDNLNDNSSAHSLALASNTEGNTATHSTGSHKSGEASSRSRELRAIRSEFQSSLKLPQRKNSFKLAADSLEISKLRFVDLGLVGRDTEIQILNDCLKKAEGLNHKENTTRQKQLVLISGEAGCGKTSLVLALKDRAAIFATGTFEHNCDSDTYSAVIDCCQEVCVQILKMRQKRVESCDDICSRIQKELLDVELHLLFTVVPLLEEVGIQISKSEYSEHLGHKELPNTREQETILLENWKTTNHKTEILESAFRKFLGVASWYFAPLVLFIDNLQWASPTSIIFLESLLQDYQIQISCVLIGCYSYRSNEIDATTTLQLLVHAVERCKSKGCIHVTECALLNLCISDIYQVLQRLLAIDDHHDETQRKNNTNADANLLALAELCHKRTMGNITFLLTFIQMLKQKDLLEYNLNLMGWAWDINKMEAETAATKNVVELLKERITTSCPAMIELLKLAACLGTSIYPRTLGLAWEKMSRNLQESIEELLVRAVEERFLEKVHDEDIRVGSTYHYRWAHDDIYEVATSLVTDDFSATVGKILIQCLNDDELEGNIFTVVNLLNGCIGEVASNIEQAELNFQAAMKAIEISAFASSEQYAAIGIANLPDDVWTSKHCTLASNLYSIGAEAAGSGLGDVEKMEEYCQVILRQPNIPINDKLRCYKVLIENIGKRKRPKEAMELAMDLLRQLGCKFPRNPLRQTVQAIHKLHRIRKNKDAINPEHVLQIPLMTDPTRVEIMKLLEKVALYAYLSKSSIVHLLATLYGIEWTLKYGLAEESPSMAFCSMGIVLMHVFGDWTTGTRYAEMALSLLENLPKQYMVSAVIMVAHSFLLCWVHPWNSRIKHFMAGYEKGMQVGDTEFATHNLGSYLFSSFVSGKKLDLVNADFEHFVPQIESFKNLEQAAWVRIYWQATLNLMGKDDNTIVLSGSAMEEAQFMEQLESFQSKQQVCGLRIFQSYLCVIFGVHERGAALALERGDRFLRDVPGLSVTMLDPFVRGMSLYAMAQKTGRRKYRKSAKRARLTLSSWLQQGNVNVVHQLKLLDAEHAVLSRRSKSNISALYKEAISFAVRCGCIQDAALANERFAEYLLLSKDEDVNDARHYLKAAVTYYSDWGAMRKVEMLELKHPSLLQQP